MDGDFLPPTEFRGKQNSLAITVQHKIQKLQNVSCFTLGGFTRSQIKFDPLFSKVPVTNINILKNYIYSSSINGTQGIYYFLVFFKYF